MTDPVIRKFRILVLDNEVEVLDFVRETLSPYEGNVHIDCVLTADEASKRIGESLYDLAILDMYGVNDLPIGTEVYRRIDAAGLSTRVLLMTTYDLKEDARHLLQLSGSPSAWRLCGFLDKQAQFRSALSGSVGFHIERFLKSEASIDGLETVAHYIKKQRYRYKSIDGDNPLRSDRLEIATEVDRLIRKLYVELPNGSERESHVSVKLEPMERRGLSAAVVLNATIDVRLADLDRDVGGHKTVLKLGPKADILEEAARFSEYVRYGVELAQRVELLAVADADALGGLVYSFAGGLYNNELLPLDEVLVADLKSRNLSMSTEVLNSLFATTNWYSVRVEPQDISDYFARNYRTNLIRSSAQGEKYLLKLAKAFDEEDGWPKVERVDEATRSSLLVTTPTGSSMTVPDASVLGWGTLLFTAPACLVHGDMHGGNVLLECSRIPNNQQNGTIVRRHQRTCLIDFRNAGPGPRCIDAVCLESTIRFADAESASRRHDAGDTRGAISAELATEMLDRFETECALYRAVFLGKGAVPDTDWAKLSATVLGGLLRCFDTVSLREYLATSIRYTIRSLGFPLPDLARCRIVAWLAAQYTLASELKGL